MKKRIKQILFLAGFWLFVVAGPAYCQIPITVSGGQQNQTPIGGMAVLAALGGGYALKKLWDSKRKA